MGCLAVKTFPEQLSGNPRNQELHHSSPVRQGERGPKPITYFDTSVRWVIATRGTRLLAWLYG